MGREIKFRGISVIKINKGEWVYGYYNQSIMSNGVKVTEIRELAGERPTYQVFCEVDPATVGQYTGLKDKNGKEIWENDIIRGVDGSIGVIRYGDHFDFEVDNRVNFFGYYVDFPRFQLSLTADSEGWAEVIGNEWENPELIKEA